MATPPEELFGPPLSRAGSDQPPAAEGPSGLERFAGRLGKASISFLSQTPQIELDRREAENALRTAQVEGLQQETEQARVAADEQLLVQNLSRIAFTPGGGADADAALNELFARDPVQADRLFEGLGAISQDQREEAARDAAAIQALPPEARRPAILERAARIEAEGRDASQTLSLLNMDPETQTNQLRVIQAAALTAAQRQSAAGTAGPTAGEREFESLAEGLSAEDQQKARRIALGLDPRAGSSARERIATDEELTEQVAASEATIKERAKFAELTGSSRANAIDKGFASIQKIDENIRNLDQAIAAIDGGALSGAVISRFSPTIRASTVALEQIQAQLGLDVVGSVQFGALSEGELQLAKAVALPTGLKPPELRAWIERRKVAQTKLRDYYADQIDFLDQGGSIPGFLRQLGQAGGAAAAGGDLSFDAQGNIIQ